MKNTIARGILVDMGDSGILEGNSVNRIPPQPKCPMELFAEFRRSSTFLSMQRLHIRKLRIQTTWW